MIEKRDLNLAVLIDADNVPYSNIKGMLDEIAKIGVPTIKRIYGDWTKPSVSGWKQPLLEHAITPIQQYSYTTGKNATDSAMIIDAMDILHGGRVDGFCLVSSDSDFTRLAVRLRESGMQVIGIGEKKTPSPFIVACDKFIYIEIIRDSDDNSETESPASTVKKQQEKTVEPVNKKLINLLKSTIRDLADDDGWAYLGDMGNLVIKKRPDFDSRNYGFSKLAALVKAQSKHFEMDERKSEKGHSRLVFVKIKE